MLKKIKGRIWIEKKNYNWVKVEAEATDTISFGLFLFRIHPGSRFVLETAHINNEFGRCSGFISTAVRGSRF